MTRRNRHENKKNIINSLYLSPEELENLNIERYKKYEQVIANETLYEETNTEDADVILVAYGTIARVALSAVKIAREQGIKAGLIRPISLWPFPSEVFAERAKTAKQFLTFNI